MKCLSLWNPWAVLMWRGHKLIETRSWYTPHRGPLAIHAAKTWDQSLHALCFDEPFASVLKISRFGDPRRPRLDNDNTPMPFGAILCVVDLYDCVEITPYNTPTGNERAFGDYTPGRYMWMTRNLRPLAEPLPCKGRQSLFDVADIAA